MSKESESKVTELTDEEMDLVSGGKALLLEKGSTGKYGKKCSCDTVHWSTFGTYLYTERLYGVCPNFIKGREFKAYHHCTGCVYFEDMGLMSESEIKEYRDQGYNVAAI